MRRLDLQVTPCSARTAVFPPGCRTRSCLCHVPKLRRCSEATAKGGLWTAACSAGRSALPPRRLRRHPRCLAARIGHRWI